jgi:threo-3-hydroxy-L-aspartate ammonia-lyase
VDADRPAGEGRAELSLTLDSVRAAASRLEGVARRTPALTSPELDREAGARVVVKAECLQRTGSFKFRGAFNAIASLGPDERRRGVVAVSSGNHAQAVALAAKLHEIPATIVMPSDAPRVKLEATASHGAEVVSYERYAEDREEVFRELIAGQDLHPIHPFDDERVIAGQGTVGLELLEDAGPLDVLVVPVSGGGLISGCATAARALLPEIRIVGVEPATADDVARSLAAGERVSIPVPRTIADGLQVTSPGELTFGLIRDLVDQVVTVSDDEIVAGMRACLDHLGLVAEPSGAVALAAVLCGRVTEAGERVGVVLSGGNVDPERFESLVGRPMPASGPAESPV